MKLTRNLFIPCLDTSETKDGTGFVQIDKSTVFELSFNANTETYSYICMANDSTEVDSYAVSMEQEIILDNSNSMFNFVYPLCMSLPTGSSANVPVLLIEPDLTTGKPTHGRLWADAVLVPSSVNTVDGKVSFTLQLNGDYVEGDVTISGGKISFTEAATVAESTTSAKATK